MIAQFVMEMAGRRINRAKFPTRDEEGRLLLHIHYDIECQTRKNDINYIRIAFGKKIKKYELIGLHFVGFGHTQKKIGDKFRYLTIYDYPSLTFDEIDERDIDFTLQGSGILDNIK